MEKILIISNHEEIIEQIGKALETHYEVYAVSTLHQAVEEMASWTSICLLDCTTAMEDLSCWFRRPRPVKRGIRRILIALLPQGEERERYLAWGADAVLPLPLEESMLTRAVGKLRTGGGGQGAMVPLPAGEDSVFQTMQQMYQILAFHLHQSVFWYELSSGAFQGTGTLADRMQLQEEQMPFPEAIIHELKLSIGESNQLKQLLQNAAQGTPQGKGILAGMEVRYTGIFDQEKRLHYVILTFAEVESRKERPAKRGEYDGLTQLLTRNAFQRAFVRMVPEARRGETNALVIVSLNHLQEVNGMLGHQYGDDLLKKAAESLTDMLREGDLLGRLGGSVFLLYLPGLRDEAVLRERMRMICAILRRKINGGLELSALLGAASLPRDGVEFEELYEKANGALNQAFQMRGDQMVLYTPELAQAGGATKAGRAAERIFVRTFGFFDVFVDGVPVIFQGKQAKELLALLVDRRGGYLTAEEAIGRLWENEPVDHRMYARYRKVAMRLKGSLEQAGAVEMIEYRNGKRRVLPNRFRCDYYQFLDDGEQNQFHGTYMANYSWGEETLAELLDALES